MVVVHNHVSIYCVEILFLFIFVSLKAMYTDVGKTMIRWPRDFAL